MRFERDRRKSAANLEKHGLAFEDAATVFAGKFVTFLDDRMDYGEERYLTLGLLMGRVVIIAHTVRGSATRIISMRKANEREKAIYQKRLEKN